MAPILKEVVCAPTLYASGKENIPTSKAGRRNAISLSPNMLIDNFANKIDKVF